MKEQFPTFKKYSLRFRVVSKYLPEILIILGIFIFFYFLLVPDASVIKRSVFQTKAAEIVRAKYQVAGIVSFSIGLVWRLRYYFNKK